MCDKMIKKKQIDFWGIGAAKAGTTWLHNNLVQLDGVFLPPNKELHYFNNNQKYRSRSKLYEKSLFERLKSFTYVRKAFKDILKAIIVGNRENLFFYWKYYFKSYSDQWYSDLFSHVSERKGEITPGYSILECEDIIKMKHCSPEAKIILMIRNPVDRAWSHFKFKKTRRNNRETVGDISDEVIRHFMTSYGQVERSNYLETLKRFLVHFPPENILVGFYDAIHTNPVELLFEVANFIGLRDIMVDPIQLEKVVNKSKGEKIPERFRTELAEYYRNDLLKMSDIFGEYCKQWLVDSFPKNSQSDAVTYKSTLTLDEVDWKEMQLNDQL